MHKKIPIVYIITKLELGGAQKVCLSLLDGLRKAGNRALLISGKQGQLASALFNDSDTFLIDSFKREISIRTLFEELKTFVEIVTLLKTLKKEFPDIIVHTHSTKAGLLGRWAALFAGIKRRIHTVHGFGFHAHQRWYAWLLNYLLELITSFITTHYICVSLQDAYYAQSLLPNFHKKYSIIRAAVDFKQFIPYAIKPHKAQKTFIFGTIACFKKQKNIFDLLKAFAYVYHRNKQVRLEIIGDGILREAIEAWIVQQQLSHAIVLHGWQKNVSLLMRHWHTFALSSLWEGLPCAIIEARLLKLPVIAYDTGGIHEVIKDGINGFLCPVKDWRTLAEKMMLVNSDKTIYQKLVAAADDLSDFNSAHMIEKHINLYRSL